LSKKVSPLQTSFLKLIQFHEFLGCNLYTTFLLFSIDEKRISCFRINESQNHFMKYLSEHKILFWNCKIQGTNENTLIFYPYVSWLSLLMWSNHQPKLCVTSSNYLSKTRLLHSHMAIHKDKFEFHITFCIKLLTFKLFTLPYMFWLDSYLSSKNWTQVYVPLSCYFFFFPSFVQYYPLLVWQIIY
jgi:hypothetical protein